MPSLLPNTEELLLICSRKDLTGPQRNRAAALIREGIDWESFLDLAIKGKVTILVNDALSKITPSAQIPQPVLDRLKSTYFSTMRKTAYQHDYMLGLLRLFAEKKIPVIPLKGTILANRVYGDISARGPSVDGDLLVEEKNIESARALMVEAGYWLSGEDPIIKPWQYYFIKKKAMSIDMHWDVTKRYRSKERMEELWKGVRLVTEDETGYYEFREEELFLYLCAQMFNDCSFVQLRYICDLHHLLHKYKNRLNWSRIAERAKRWKISNSLYAALSLSGSFFNSEVPAGALKSLKPALFKIMLLRCFVNKKVILGNGFRRRLMNNLLRPVFFELIEAESAKDYFSIIFPSRETRNKSWAARVITGISALSRMFPERKGADSYPPDKAE